MVETFGVMPVDLKQMWSRCYSIALRKTKSPENSEDIAQNALIKYITNLDKIDHSLGETKVRNYIISIFYNEIVSYIRTLKRRGSETELPDNLTYEPEMPVELTEAIEKLSTREKTIIYWFYFEGMDSEAIGEKLKLDPANVRQIKLRALRKMRQFMAAT